MWKFSHGFRRVPQYAAAKYHLCTQVLEHSSHITAGYSRVDLALLSFKTVRKKVCVDDDGNDDDNDDDELPGKSLREQVNSVDLLWVTGIKHYQAVKVSITYVTCNGT